MIDETGNLPMFPEWQSGRINAYQLTGEHTFKGAPFVRSCRSVRQHGETHCAAACLEMVYQTFGVNRDQRAIFDERSVIRPTNPQERWMLSHSIALDAQHSGLRALAFKPKDLIATLRTCMDNDCLVILEQCMDLKQKSHVGHMRLCAKRVGLARFQVFDPYPSHRSPIEMTAHMIRQLSAENRLEIVGDYMVGIGNNPLRIERCEECGGQIPWEAPCSHCRQPIHLDLSALIGCLNPRCTRSNFSFLTCPHCNSEPPRTS